MRNKWLNDYYLKMDHEWSIEILKEIIKGECRFVCVTDVRKERKNEKYMAEKQ